jgi:hypothetical protein
MQPTNPIELFHELSGANAAAASMPRQRRSINAQGLVLFFPRTGLVMVPYEYHNDSWTCVVVFGDETYKVGGYNLCVSHGEIETALEVGVGVLPELPLETPVIGSQGREGGD